MNDEERLNRQLLNELTKYPLGTAMAAVRLKGDFRLLFWPFHVARGETAETLRVHIKRWFPGVEFVSAAVKV